MKFIQIGDAHFDDEIIIARHQMTFDNIGDELHLEDKALPFLDVFFGKRAKEIDREIAIHFLRIENGDIAVNKFVFFENIDPAQAGRIGKADFLCQFVVVQVSILLQRPQDAGIDIVRQLVFRHKCCSCRRKAIFGGKGWLMP